MTRIPFKSNGFTVEAEIVDGNPALIYRSFQVVLLVLVVNAETNVVKVLATDYRQYSNQTTQHQVHLAEMYPTLYKLPTQREKVSYK